MIFVEHLRARRRVPAGLVKAEGIRRGADHVRQLTVIGDGAAWIWNLAAATFPEATHIVDLYHAREHLHSLTGSLEFMLGDRKDEWLAARLEDLDYGDIDGIEAAVREYPLEGVKKDEADRELGYFLNNAPRMRYHWFRSRGLFTGSGVVKAGCKSVIGQRLKQSGMHWTVAGADFDHHPPLRRGQRAMGTIFPLPPQPDRSRLTCPHPKMILVTYESDVHPVSGRRSRSTACRCMRWQ